MTSNLADDHSHQRHQNSNFAQPALKRVLHNAADDASGIGVRAVPYNDHTNDFDRDGAQQLVPGHTGSILPFQRFGMCALGL